MNIQTYFMLHIWLQRPCKFYLDYHILSPMTLYKQVGPTAYTAISYRASTGPEQIFHYWGATVEELITKSYFNMEGIDLFVKILG